MTTEPWAEVDVDAYGQMTCPIPGCDEPLYLHRTYMIPLVAEQDDEHDVTGAVSDHWEVKCVGDHMIYNAADHARVTDGYDETSEVAIDYNHRAVHEISSALGGVRA